MSSKKQQRYRKEPSETENIPHQILDLIFDSFKHGFDVDLSEKSKSFVKSNYGAFFTHYVLDFFVCNFVIAPAIISVWRGVWDYSLIWLEGTEDSTEGLLTNTTEALLTGLIQDCTNNRTKLSEGLLNVRYCRKYF